MTRYCYKAIEGSQLDKAVKKHFEQQPLWIKVIDSVNEMLGENISRFGDSPEHLFVDIDQIKKEENKKLFTKDGKLKSNTKQAKELNQKYSELIKSLGLEDYERFGAICFTYNLMRYSTSQSVETFKDHNNLLYLKCNFDLNNRWGHREDNKHLQEISEIEYEETYLNLLKEKKSE